MRSGLLAIATVTALSATALGGCATVAPAQKIEVSSTAAGLWPRTVQHDAGVTTIDEKPARIVSVSPSITGSLLALGAPIAATAAATVSPLTDDKGFFTQWASIADSRDVEVLYSDLELDLDAIDLFEPDLIIGSVNGGDASLEAYDQLSEIAPTVLLDYGTATWQELTTELGDITGLEKESATTITEYDAWVDEQANGFSLPKQPVTAAVYMGAEGMWAFGADSPQAQLLTDLGFTYEEAAEKFRSEKGGANGIDVLTAENAASGLAGSQTLFLVAMGGGDPVAQFTGDPLLANQPAVAAERVHSLGTEAFRLDYYSARSTVKLIVDTFSQ